MRIREDVLERDYCLAWFLSALSVSELRQVFAFKGGTALKRCYFSDYRFSEDLDFTLRQQLAFEDIRAHLERVYAIAHENSGITFVFDRQDRQTHVNSYTFYLRYTGPLPAGNDVKVVTVQTDPGYSPNPGHDGTGTVTSIICQSSSKASKGSASKSKGKGHKGGHH